MERAGVGAAALLLDGSRTSGSTGRRAGGEGQQRRRRLRRRARAQEEAGRGRRDPRRPPSDIRGDARAKLQAWQRAGGKVQTVTADKLEPLARALGRAVAWSTRSSARASPGRSPGYPPS
jgi:hypothetical protein